MKIKITEFTNSIHSKYTMASFAIEFTAAPKIPENGASADFWMKHPGGFYDYPHPANVPLMSRPGGSVLWK
jgi:hypothetical protein